MSLERRDLATTFMSESGYEVSIPVGGLSVLNSQKVDVHFSYRGGQYNIRLPEDASIEAMIAEIVLRVAAIDEDMGGNS